MLEVKGHILEKERLDIKRKHKIGKMHEPDEPCILIQIW